MDTVSDEWDAPELPTLGTDGDGPADPDSNLIVDEYSADTTEDSGSIEWLDAGNGVFYATLDIEGDGPLEALIVDVNGDGVPDILVERIDGGYRQSVDVDQDGVFEEVTEFTDAEMAANDPTLVEIMAGAFPVAEEPVINPTVDDGAIVGDPFAFGDDWFEQSFNGSCVPASLATIYSEYTGTSISDEGFVELANQLGLWVVDADGVPGMLVADAEVLLDSVGIPSEYVEGLTVDDLTAFLTEPPHAVMVAVDADTIWYGEEADGLNHVVLVTGIDVESGIVYVSDTGTPDGNMTAVDLDLFLEAWSASDNAAVVAEVSAEEYRQSEDLLETTTAIVESAPRGETVGDPEAALGDAAAPEAVTGVGTEAGGATLTADVFSTGRPDFDLGEIAPVPDEPFAVVGQWVSHHPWVLIPVTLGAAAVIRGAVASATRNKD